MDGTNLEKMLAETSVNNTFELKSVEYTNKMLNENSFWYLYQLQKDYICFKEFHFKTKNSDNPNAIAYGDMYLDVKGRVCIDVNTELLYLHKRHSFYHSKFYKKEFTLTDIENNPALFQRIPLLIIDNRSIFDYQIRLNEKCVTFILPFKMDFILYGDKRYIDHKTDLFLFPNRLKSYKLTTNKSMLNQYGGYDKIPAQLIGNDVRFEDDGTYLVFLMSKSGSWHSSFQTAKAVSDILLDVTMDESVKQAIATTSGNLTLKILYVKEMYEYVPYNGVLTSTPLNAIEIESQVALIEREPGIHYNMPIPTENTMVLKLDRTKNKWITYKENTTRIKYPNMYLISDENMMNRDKYRLFYFYYKGYDLHYDHIFDFFYRFLERKYSPMSIEEIINKMYFKDPSILKKEDEPYAEKWFDTFSKVFEYNDFHYSYGTVDYVKYKNNQSPFEYKVNQLKDFVLHDQYALKKYVLMQNRIRDNYELYVSKIDLPSRIRYDTSQELKYNHLDFGGKPYYVFQFSNTARNGLISMRIFIDGLLNVDYHHIYENLVDYIYIPASDLTENSYIEIEVFHSYQYSKQIAFSYVGEEIYVEFPRKENVTPTKQDLLLSNGITGESLSFESFKIERMVDGNFYDINYVNEDVPEDNKRHDIDFSIIDKFRITALDESVTNIYVNLDIYKNSYLRVVKPKVSTFPSTAIKNVKFNGDIDYLRVFVNGRLVSRNLITIRTGGGNINVQVLLMVNPEDTLVIDITPFKYEHVYSVSELEDRKYPIVDLKEYIDKPIDIRYFDIFLNGRKLTKNEVYPLNSHLLTFNNIHSLSGLNIFQRDRDYEYFGVDYTEHDYPFDLGDLIDHDGVTDDEEDDAIKDEIDDNKDPDAPDNGNDNTEEEVPQEPDENMLFRLFYYTELLPRVYLDPNIVQFEDELIQTDFEEDIYIPYMIHESRTPSNPNDYTTNNVLILNPDVHYNDAEEVYMVGGDALNDRDADVVEEPNG